MGLTRMQEPCRSLSRAADALWKFGRRLCCPERFSGFFLEAFGASQAHGGCRLTRTKVPKASSEHVHNARVVRKANAHDKAETRKLV